jgi:hypothetical protein
VPSLLSLASHDRQLATSVESEASEGDKSGTRSLDAHAQGAKLSAKINARREMTGFNSPSGCSQVASRKREDCATNFIISSRT